MAWVERRQGQRCTIRRGVIVVAPHDTKVFQEAASAGDLLAVEIFTVHTVSGIDPAQSVTIRFAGLRLNLVARIINPTTTARDLLQHFFHLNTEDQKFFVSVGTTAERSSEGIGNVDWIFVVPHPTCVAGNTLNGTKGKLTATAPGVVVDTKSQFPQAKRPVGQHAVLINPTNAGAGVPRIGVGNRDLVIDQLDIGRVGGQGV